MSENRDIEQRLRDYGKKRQGESSGSPELHPATRRLLQGEVSRVYGVGRAATPVSSGWAHGNWTRFGLAFALFLGLGVAAVLLMKVKTPIGNETQMVRVTDDLGVSPADGPMVELPLAPQATPSPAELRPEAAPSPAATSAGTSPPLRESQIALQDAAALSADGMKRDAKAADDKDSSDGLRRLPDVKQNVDKVAVPALRPSIAPNKNEQPTDASLAGLPLGPAVATNNALLAESGASLSAWETGAAFDGKFTKTAQPGSAGLDATSGASRGAGAAEDILSDFQFFYGGGEVRITDRDGSVYLGRASPTIIEVDEALAAKVPNPTGAISTVRRLATDDGGRVRHLAFEVVGTNRTLNQRVSFNGVVAPQTELKESEVAKRLQASKSTVELATVEPTTVPPASQTNPVRSRAAAPAPRTDALPASPPGVARGVALGGSSAVSAPGRTNSVLQIQGRVKVGTQPELPLRWAGESVNR